MFFRIAVLLAVLGLVSGFLFNGDQLQTVRNNVNKLSELLPFIVYKCTPEATCLTIGETPTDVCHLYVLRCVVGSLMRVKECPWELGADLAIQFWKYGYDWEEHDVSQALGNIASNCLGYDLDYVVTAAMSVGEEAEKYVK